MSSKKKISTRSIILTVVAILVILAVNAIVISVISNPFNKMGDIDMDNLSNKSEASQIDVSSADIQKTNNTNDVSASDADLIYPEYPYFIEVDITNQVITIYTTSSSGKYDKIVRRMLCSTAQVASKFPEGYWKLKEDRCSEKNVWRTMKSHGTALYAQYATQITGDFLFHSVPYTSKNKNDLDVSRFKKLGVADSGGCIRLTVENAKWICQNCKAGTTVHIVANKENPELTAALKEALPLPDSSGWDPTDPDPDNPNYQPQYTDPDPEPEGYVKENFEKITYSKEIAYVS